MAAELELSERGIKLGTKNLLGVRPLLVGLSTEYMVE